jgi:hypothetical protein
MQRTAGYLLLISLASLYACEAVAENVPDYSNTIQPIFTRYCTGCHNSQDAEGELSLESYTLLREGGAEGPVIAASAQESRLLDVLTGSRELAMPPEGEPQPKPEEIELLVRWMDAGAPGPEGDLANTRQLRVPQLPPSLQSKPVTAVALSPNGKYRAVARFRTIELLETGNGKLLHRLDGHAGKINDLRFTSDSRELIAAGGIAGLYGEVRLWDVKTGKPIRTFSGHDDTVYVAVVDRKKQLLATGSYDHQIIIWDFDSGEKKHLLAGHNGPVFDLALSPDGKNLVSASGDATVKIWHVPTGRRLDTRSEPLKEQYSVAFSPDGLRFAAAGADNRIRLWKLVSRDQMKINPIVHARYGHDGVITRLRYAADGGQLVSTALDGAIKVWQMPELRQQAVYGQQSDTIEALAVNSANRQIVVGRMDGSLGTFPLPETVIATDKGVAIESQATLATGKPPSNQLQEAGEAEPNDTVAQAQLLEIPAVASGVIQNRNGRDGNPDVDLYRFHSRAGETWVLQIEAARNQSALDSKIEVLDDEGNPVIRVLLQAVRDSYFTYRGKNSNQTDDFRLHNSGEMKLNQYLYANGEVVRLYHYPRGPDSGFKVYPNFDQRFGYFDTTPITHALGEVCYIVEPHATSESITPNGLPVFPIYYENDDDSERKLGADSRLTFIAPDDGDYLVRVRDIRGFEGEAYQYKLYVRTLHPDFELRTSQDPAVPPGGFRRFNIKLKRMDGFDGPVDVEITGLPPGFSVAGPLVVEAGQQRASGTIRADLDAPAPTEENSKMTKVIAKATINGKRISREVGSLGEIKLDEPAKLKITIHPENESLTSHGLPVLVMPAGKTIKCTLRVDREDHDGVVGFGHEEAAWNLPHGIYVDNIGLNGVLMLAEENEREVFITSEPWVKESERPIFFEAAVDRRPASSPVMLRVVPDGH